MKILHIVYSCVPNVYRGGVAKAAFELAQAQAALGHEVTIFTTNVNSGEPLPYTAKHSIVHSGVTIIYFPLSPFGKRWMVSNALRKELMARAAQFDVLHAHNTFLALNLYAATAASKYNTPLFFHVHGALDPRIVFANRLKAVRKLPYIWLIERRNYAQAQGLFVFSSAESEQLATFHIAAPRHILPNGIASVNFSTQRAKLASAFRQQQQVSHDAPIVLYIGRIVSKKAVHILLKAIAHARKTVPNLVVAIGGNRQQDPTYTKLLDTIIAEEKLEKSVRWLGFLNDEQKKTALAAATVFSHVSESEGMAMAILEAMSAGLPTLVSTMCYMTDAAAAGAVIEIDLKPEPIGQQLIYLSQNPDHAAQIGHNAQRYALDNHSWKTIAKNVESIYLDSLLDREQTVTSI